MMDTEPIIVSAVAIGIVLPALLNIGIFATKADLEKLRGDIAMAYVLKAELERRLDKIENQIQQLIDKFCQDS